MSLLTLIQNAADRIGVVRPSTVISSSDPQVVRLLGMAQQEGKALAERHDWQVLTKESTFTATATETQSSVLPSAFDRFVDQTFYNRSKMRPVLGPVTAQDWQQIKATVSVTVVEAFRQRGSSTDLLFTPTPTVGDSYAFEYISKNWCAKADATEQSAWALDTDTGILDEELMTLGVVWRFKAAQGLDYSEEFRNYELMFAQRTSRDGGKPRIRVGFGGALSGLIVQEGSWNLS